MKKCVSIILSAVMAMSCFNALGSASVSAEDETITLTADKTAQWKANADDTTAYDLRIHGYTGWQTSAYIGFSLPEDFTSESLKSAKLVIYTVSASSSASTSIYSAQYDAFDNGAQYAGSDAAPAYDTTKLVTFSSPTAAGEFEIDVTNYVTGIKRGSTSAAMRIDTTESKANRWMIGS